MTTLSHSRRLRQSIEEVLPELTSATSAIVSHPRFREIYAELLITIHQFVRATVPLMAAALDRCREIQDNDPVAAAMVPYYEHHIKEELHHDDWVLEDLESIGVPRADVLCRMPPPALASAIGALYYWIRHHHPVAQLGQVAAQEGYPPSRESIDLMVARSGYERLAFRTLEKHSTLDVHHRDDFDAALNQMPLTDEHHAILRVSALNTVRMSAQVYREVLARDTIPLKRPDLISTRIGGNGDFRVDDPRTGDRFQLGAEAYFLLTQCDGVKNPNEVCQAFSEQFRQPLSRASLEEFLETARSEHWFATTNASLSP